MSDDGAKKKLAAQLEQFGDQRHAFIVSGIQQQLRMCADGALLVARPYEHDEWARDWVEMVKSAAATLGLAAISVQIQPLAPHGKVPS